MIKPSRFLASQKERRDDLLLSFNRDNDYDSCSYKKCATCSPFINEYTHSIAERICQRREPQENNHRKT